MKSVTLLSDEDKKQRQKATNGLSLDEGESSTMYMHVYPRNQPVSWVLTDMHV